MFSRVIDSVVAAISPQKGLDRVSARASLEAIDKLMGGSTSGYDAAKLNRLLKLVPNQNENAIDFGQLDRLEARSRDLWRNNASARKVVRQIQVKTLGKGMRPLSQATTGDGKPHFKFRSRARDIWSQFVCQSDSRGKPGRGGDHFSDQGNNGLAAIVRNGNLLSRTKMLSRAEQRRKKLLLPLQVQLIDAGRLDQSLTEHEGREVFRGIELNDDGVPAAYHVLPYHPSDPRGHRFGTNSLSDSVRFKTDELLHVFVSEDIDQLLGVSWFAPALSHTRDAGDYEYAELKAAAMGACVVASIKRPAGSDKFGIHGTENDPLTDENGNKITRLQPGMFLDGVEISGFNPQRPGANAEPFIQHLLRRISTAFPGIKGSTLTGDYRRSSFASERSADNEIWPEIEGVQQWWACAFQTPLYIDVITTAVLTGLFDDIVSTGEFTARSQQFLAVDWQGPVGRSINPKDDEEASELGRRNMTSSVSVDAAKKGFVAIELLQDQAEFIGHIDDLELDDDLKELMKLQTLGLGAKAISEIAAPDSADDGSDGGGDDDESDDRSLRVNRIAEHLGVA